MNTTDVFEHDGRFVVSQLQTLYYAVACVAGATAVSLALALVLNQRLKTIGFYRSFFFLPAVTSLVDIAMVRRWIYNTECGLLNAFLG